MIKVAVDGTVKNLFFTMFLFALGYKVGPQFFRGLKKSSPTEHRKEAETSCRRRT